MFVKHFVNQGAIMTIIKIIIIIMTETEFYPTERLYSDCMHIIFVSILRSLRNTACAVQTSPVHLLGLLW